MKIHENIVLANYKAWLFSDTLDTSLGTNSCGSLQLHNAAEANSYIYNSKQGPFRKTIVLWKSIVIEWDVLLQYFITEATRPALGLFNRLVSKLLTVEHLASCVWVHFTTITRSLNIRVRVHLLSVWNKHKVLKPAVTPQETQATCFDSFSSVVLRWGPGLGSNPIPPLCTYQNQNLFYCQLGFHKWGIFSGVFGADWNIEKKCIYNKHKLSYPCVLGAVI